MSARTIAVAIAVAWTGAVAPTPAQAVAPFHTEARVGLEQNSLRVKSELPDNSDIRLFEYEAGWHAPGDSAERIFVVHLPNGELSMDASAGSICRRTRVPGEWRTVKIQPGTIECRARAFAEVQIEGNAEEDVICVVEPIDVDVDTPLVIRGLGEIDSVTGGAGDDTLSGGSRFDIIRGRDGTDSIFGYEAPLFDDLEQPVDDHDMLFGEAGADLIYGGPRNDVLVGGAGADVLCGSDAETTFALSCQDLHGRDGGFNDLYADESKDRDLNTGLRFSPPLPPEADHVDCGGASQNRIAYNAGVDSLFRCPRPGATEPPSQASVSYPALSRLRGRTCPRVE